MKSFIAPTYTFTPGASGVGAVNLSGISSFNIKYLVSVINQTKGELVYSTASAALRYTNVSGTTVTLFKDTSGMSPGDVLQVIYEIQTETLPTGASTEAKQDTGNSSLSSVDGKLTTLNAKDFATSSKQDTANTSLSSIDTKTPALVAGKVPVDTGLTQSLTDTQLRATAVPTAPNISRGNGVIDSNTQRVTLATDGATAVAIGSIDTKTPTLDNSKQPVVPSMTSGGNLSVQTAATGTNWTAFASQALKQLTVSNQTGTSIEFRQGGAGVGFIVPNGSIFTFFGITNANQIEARRVDTSNTQVTVTARWES